MNRVRRAFAGGVAVISASVLLFSQVAAFGWGDRGHTYINEVAARKIPASMPAFMRTAAAIAHIAYLGPEPDRWRDKTAYALNNAQAPDHFINLESIAGIGDLPREGTNSINSYTPSAPQPPRMPTTTCPRKWACSPTPRWRFSIACRLPFAIIAR